ncbi:penicillin-binding protein 2 [Olsenella sp. An290]|uniref:penicillin-binding protein 2 n=1 Tax=Olsenella sp. An290 TaxID=1965625 RepID=UPI000B384DE6|nr:penicillin-binding protein 2 [Olsenella sp. An290]OUO34918.1 penicillin-binding protein 2 [Olsenella sp. An290]
MDLSLVIIIACAVLAVALIVVFLVFGRGEQAFTLDIGGSSPRASGGSDASPEKTLSSRLVGLAVVVGGVFATLVARLWSMQLVSSEQYAEQAESNRTSTVYTQAPRGRILDRNGVELVGNRPSLTVAASSEVLDDEVEVTLLANLIGMPAQAVRRKLQDTTEGYQSLRTISVDVSRRVVAYVGEHPEVFPGVRVQERTQRSYPFGTLAAHVVGYTGTVTDDQLKASAEGGEGTVAYRSGDVVGQTGIEYEYESVLQGVRGEQVVYVDAHGNVLGESTSIAPQSGSDLVLTIDVNVQKTAEESLARILEEQRASGRAAVGGSVVVLDCTNGEVLAMASAPTFSPSSFVGGISTADWDALQAEGSNYPMLNRAIAGQYAPGSVIKPLTSFAALDKGIATPQSSWYCTGWWTWSGNQSDTAGMRCWKRSGHGAIGLSGGITYSCDVVFYEIGKGFYYSESDPEGMQETFRRYGLGSATGIDLPGEEVGRVPDAQWKWDHYKSMGYSDEDCTWQGGENANLAIGQGDLLVTSLQMATAYCGIANGGPVWRPHLMRGVRSRIGDGLVSEYRCEQLADVEEDAGFRDVVATGMQGVVYEEDPAQTSHWTNLDVTVRGKTGTAEQTASDRSVCWFGAYAPAEDPRYVVFSNVDGGSGGGATAMLVVRDVFGQIYGQPDTSTVPVAGID